MKKLSLTALIIFFSVISFAANNKVEKPVQHLKLADITTLAEAEKVFIEKTAQLKKIEQLDEVELEEIHIITYSLEKSFSYYVKHLSGKDKSLALAMAAEVEQIHLNSENNRLEKTKIHLNRYLKMAQYLPLTK